MPLDVGAILTGEIDRLTAAGVPATADPRNTSQPPVALIGPPDIEWGFGPAGRARLTFTATIIGPSGGTPEALSALSPVLATAARVTAATGAVAVDVPAADGGNPRPAYQIRWQVMNRV